MTVVDIIELNFCNQWYVGLMKICSDSSQFLVSLSITAQQERCQRQYVIIKYFKFAFDRPFENIVNNTKRNNLKSLCLHTMKRLLTGYDRKGYISFCFESAVARSVPLGWFSDKSIDRAVAVKSW